MAINYYIIKKKNIKPEEGGREGAGAEGGAKERALMKANAKQERRTKESARRAAE